MIKKDDKWQALVERYFEGETTLDEEKALRAFLAENDDPEYDGVRAVMGYVIAAKDRPARSGKIARWIPAVAVAAAVSLLVWINVDKDQCVIYDGTDRISDNALVMAEVNNTLESFFGDNQRADVDEILEDLFN